MCDAHTVLQAMRTGYSFRKDDATDSWWYYMDTKSEGPFKSITDAAHEAIADHEINEAYKFWKGKNVNA